MSTHSTLWFLTGTSVLGLGLWLWLVRGVDYHLYTPVLAIGAIFSLIEVIRLVLARRR